MTTATAIVTLANATAPATATVIDSKAILTLAIRNAISAAIEAKRYPILFNAFFSTDSPKAIKASKLKYLNAINYMAPAKSGGFGNVCTNYSISCFENCLGAESGQAAMVDKKTGTNNVRESRKRKAGYFFVDNKSYMREMFIHVAKLIAKARKMRFKLAVRPNGSADIPYENIKIQVDEKFAAYLSELSGKKIRAGIHTVFSAFPMIQFVDYTKNPMRLNRPLPANYHLTFSRSEKNENFALAFLARGINVAIVFDVLPSTWNGYTVIDGDEHDLRFLDPTNPHKGYVVGLTQKGNKIKREARGFVVRGYRE